MRYEVYKMNVGKDDELVASNMSIQEAEELAKENPNYVIVPQHINGG